MKRNAACIAFILFLAGCDGSASKASVTTTTVAKSGQNTQVLAAFAGFRLPLRMSRPAVVSIGDHALALGGLTTGDVSTNAVINVGGSSASQVGKLHDAVHDAAATPNGPGALVFGGGGAHVVNTVQRWDQAGFSDVGKLPHVRADLVAAKMGDRSFVAGGTNGQTLEPDVLSTTDGMSFTDLGALAQPVRYPALAVMGNELWLFGGETQATEGGTAVRVDTIQKFDVAGGKGTIVGHMPSPVSHAMAFNHDGALFVAGGRTAGGATSDIFEVDSEKGTTALRGKLPDARSDAGTAALGSKIYLVGGEFKGPADPLDSVILVSF